MAISKRERIIFAVTLTVVLASLVYSFIIEPIYKEYTNFNQQVRLKSAELAKNLRLMRESRILGEEFKRYSQKFIFKGIDKEEAALVLGELEEIGQASGVYLSELKPQGVKDVNSHKLVLVEIKFKATMSSLVKFVYELEHSEFLLKVNSLQLIRKTDGQYLLEGDIKVSRFYFAS